VEVSFFKILNAIFKIIEWNGGYLFFFFFKFLKKIFNLHSHAHVLFQTCGFCYVCVPLCLFVIHYYYTLGSSYMWPLLFHNSFYTHSKIKKPKLWSMVKEPKLVTNSNIKIKQVKVLRLNVKTTTMQFFHSWPCKKENPKNSKLFFINGKSNSIQANPIYPIFQHDMNMDGITGLVKKPIEWVQCLWI